MLHVPDNARRLPTHLQNEEGTKPMTEQIFNLAPIAIFVFKRPEHTARMLAGLAANPEFLASPLFIFSDGARNAVEQVPVDAVRQLLADFAHPQKTLVLAPANQGLAKSITQGVTQLCSKYGQVIVVEDDLAVAPSFLNYMNTALTKYAEEPRVMQISGHMFPVDLKVETDAVFMPVTTSWGWATWQRAWTHMKTEPELALQKLGSRRWRRRFDLNGSFPYARMLAERLAGRNHSWAIWWYFQVFMHDGICLFPAKSLVNNEGFDGSGTHCADKDVATMVLGATHITSYPEVVSHNEAFRTYQQFLSKDRGFVKRNYDRAWRLFFSTRSLHVA